MSVQAKLLRVRRALVAASLEFANTYRGAALTRIEELKRIEDRLERHLEKNRRVA